MAKVSKTETKRRRVGGALWFGSRFVAVSSLLAAVTVFVGPFAAVIVVCGMLWAALFFALRSVKQEREKVDVYLSKVRDKYDSIIGALAGAMNLQDDMNAHRINQVMSFASMIAGEMGMRKTDILLTQKAAIVADVGKIEIAQGILSKPGELTDEEWKEMKRHPELGYQILSGISHLRDAGDIVLAHHERFDGQGYPRGLKGEEIPLGARILAVVDAYIAMTSDRPHRKKMAHEMALKEILRNSLTQFDPEVVRAFVRCEERGLISNEAGTGSDAAATEREMAKAS